jgi:hypothetical protein
MFGFLKKLFGGDATTNKEAGVQIEQAPYKVPEPAAITPAPSVATDKVAKVNSQPLEVKQPAKQAAPKQGVAKKAAPKKEAAKKPARGRKPKAK